MSKAVFILLFFLALQILPLTVLIRERKDQSKALFWLFIALVLPVLGFLLYLLLQPKNPGSCFFCQSEENSREKHSINDLDISSIELKLINLLERNSFAPLTVHNEVQVYHNEDVFTAFFNALRSAEEHIHLETYILKDDKLGSSLAELLLQKAGEGVKVRVIYDAFGSSQLDRSFLAKLKSGGVELHSAQPFRLNFSAASKANFRNHRKILVIDSRIAFIGGMNITDDCLGQNPKIGFWRDTHLKVRGESVAYLQRIFAQDYEKTSGKKLPLEIDLVTNKIPDHLYSSSIPLQIFSGSPDYYWENTMQAFFTALTLAVKTIYITTPYFAPNESILTALKCAAMNGLDIKLLLPAYSDNPLAQYASLSFVEELILSGVQVYLYQMGFLHAKSITIDSSFALLGSANFDQRSFKYNYETNIIIYDKFTVLSLENTFRQDLAYSTLINKEDFSRRPAKERYLEAGARLFAPML